MLKRVEDKIDKNSLNGCWIWTSNVRNGYGLIKMNGRQESAHRYVYKQLVGPITEETLDHLCKVKRCVNPDHLEPISLHINILRGNGMAARHARKTHCAYGHEFTLENTLTRKTKNGVGRVCKICLKRREKARDRAAQVK